MEKIFLYTLLFSGLISLMAISCEKEREQSWSQPNLVSIGELREMYNGESTIIDSKSQEVPTYVGGVVIMDASNGNNPDNKLFIQNYENGELRGIILSIEDAGRNRYSLGDSVVANIEGKELRRINGSLEVSSLSMRDVGRVSSGHEQRINIVTDQIDNVLREASNYESTLVSIQSVVSGAERGQLFSDKDLILSDGENTLSVATHASASFASNEVPRSGYFNGILMQSNSQQPYLIIRHAADYDGEYFPPINYAGFPEGFENSSAIQRKTPTSATTSGEGIMSSGSWYYTNGADNSSAAWVNGSFGVLLHGGNAASIEMMFDLEYGASEFSFGYATVTTGANDRPAITLYPEYSQDGGETWLPVDPAEPSITFAEQYTLLTYEKTDLNIEGSVRFRIRKNAGGGRPVLDDIFVKPNTD